MHQRAFAGLLAAVVVLLATVLIVQATRSAEAGSVAGNGDPCPSDIDNDGTVGITDFLQLLGDWGPCPAATIVDGVWSTGGPGTVLFRIWSDGFAEARPIDFKDPKGMPFSWLALPDNPDAPASQPIAVSTNINGRYYRFWADGTVDYIDVGFNVKGKGRVPVIKESVTLPD